MNDHAHTCTERNESSSVRFFGMRDIVVFALATAASSLSEPKVDCFGPHAGVVDCGMGSIFSWAAAKETTAQAMGGEAMGGEVMGEAVGGMTELESNARRAGSIISSEMRDW
jgi:hypothetical protein